MPNHSGQGSTKERQVEVLWVKPVASFGLRASST
jgi:hypothetical protein